MRNRLPDDVVLAALGSAVLAPSVDGTQPWRFGLGDRELCLYLEGSRARPGLDPGGRELVLSCGAALHHLCVALAASGWLAVVRRLPDSANPDHLASIGLIRHRPTMTDVALNAAIPRRRCDHRPFGAGPCPPGYLGLVSERAAAVGGSVRRATPESRDRLVEVMRARAAEGVSSRNCSVSAGESEIVIASRSVEPDRADVLVLCTEADERESWLRAGEAASAVLLTATNIGLATCLMIGSLAVCELRSWIGHRVFVGAAYPQAVVRIGSAPVGAALPVSRRGPLGDVFERFDTDGHRGGR